MSGIRPYTAADLERLRSIQAPPGGSWTHATRDQVREYRDANGHLVQVVLDQAGNQVRRRRRRIGGRWVDVQDVRINLRTGV